MENQEKKERKPISLNMNARLAYALAGAVTVASSVGLVVNYSLRKKAEKTVYAAELILGIVGITAGLLIAYEPERRARRGVYVEELFDEGDAVLADRQISETLNRRADRGAQEPVRKRTIEVDEESTIEDFI